MFVSIGECGPTDTADEIVALADIGAATEGGGIVGVDNDEGGGGGGGGDVKINGVDEPTRVSDTEEDCESCDKEE